MYEIYDRYLRSCLPHHPPLYSLQAHLSWGWYCSGHREDDNFRKRGVDLSDRDTAAVICVHPLLITDVLSKHGCETPVQPRCLHFRACMQAAYTGVVWGFQRLSQRTYFVWPHVLVRPSWLLCWEPRAAKLFSDFCFVGGAASIFLLGVSSVDLGASTCDFVLGKMESRGFHSPCMFSVRTILFVA